MIFRLGCSIEECFEDTAVAMVFLVHGRDWCITFQDGQPDLLVHCKVISGDDWVRLANEAVM